MIITINYNELKEIISNRTNGKVNLDLCYVNYDTVKVSYKHVAFLPAVNVNVQIKKSWKFKDYSFVERQQCHRHGYKRSGSILGFKYP